MGSSSPETMSLTLRSHAHKCLSGKLVDSLLDPFAGCIDAGMIVEVENCGPLFGKQRLITRMSPAEIDIVAMAWAMLELSSSTYQQVEGLFRSGKHTSIPKLVNSICGSWEKGLLSKLPYNFIYHYNVNPLVRAMLILIDCCILAAVALMKQMELFKAWKFVVEGQHILNLCLNHSLLRRGLRPYSRDNVALVNGRDRVHVDLHRLETFVRLYVDDRSESLWRTNPRREDQLRSDLAIMEFIAIRIPKLHLQMDYKHMKQIWDDQEVRNTVEAYLSTLWTPLLTLCQTRAKAFREALSVKDILGNTSIEICGNTYTFRSEKAYDYTIPENVRGWQMEGHAQ